MRGRILFFPPATAIAIAAAGAAAAAPAPARITAPAGEAAAEPSLALSPPSVATGGIAVVRVEGLAAGDAVTGTFNGEAIPFAAGPGVATALLGVDLDVKPGRYPLKVRVARAGKTIARDRTVQVFDGKYPEQSFTVPKEKDSSDDPALTERIAREAKELAAIWPEWTADRLWEGAFAPPAPGAMKNFGSRRIINGTARRPHSGADQPAKEGDPIHAINAGKVAFTGDQFFGGKTTVIDHGQGLYSMYMHQSKIEVEPGQVVRKGDKIGEAGMTGRATGAHLHWGLRLLGARVDPAKLLALEKELDAMVSLSAAGPPSPSPMTAGTDGGAVSGGG